jgi:hypothetical protein
MGPYELLQRSPEEVIIKKMEFYKDGGSTPLPYNRA